MRAKIVAKEKPKDHDKKYAATFGKLEGTWKQAEYFSDEYLQQMPGINTMAMYMVRPAHVGSP